MHHLGVRRLCGSIVALLFVLPLSVQTQAGTQDGKKTDGLKPVTSERLLKGTNDPSAWLMYGGNYQSWRVCCGPTNRGVAIADDKVFMATLDARLVALDRKTGAVVWNTKMDEYANGYSATVAPLVVRDKVIVGIAGGEYGIRGYIDAYDVQTGERKWRRYTIPGEGEKGVETWAGDSWKNGGGPTWITGAYDPEQNVLFWATGNTSPDWNGEARAGDNLYTDSVLALDPETGELKWYFQFTPHDIWDYDGNTDLFLVPVQRSGKVVKALAQPNRNGYLYVL